RPRGVRRDVVRAESARGQADGRVRSERAEVPLDRQADEIVFLARVERLDRTADGEVAGAEVSNDAVFGVLDLALENDVESRSIAVASPTHGGVGHRVVDDDVASALDTDPERRMVELEGRTLDLELSDGERAAMGQHRTSCWRVAASRHALFTSR